MTALTKTFGALTALGLLASMPMANAATVSCTADNSTVTVGPALGCTAVANSNDSQTTVRSLTFSGPGGTYGPFGDLVYLDKDNRGEGEFEDVILNNENNTRPGISENAFYGDTNPSNLQGSFTIDLNLLTGFTNFVVFIKPGNDGVYFLIDTAAAVANAINGTYTITFSGWTGNPGVPTGISHMSLYGSPTTTTTTSTTTSTTTTSGTPSTSGAVPEPTSTLTLLGLGLIGLGYARRARRVNA